MRLLILLCLGLCVICASVATAQDAIWFSMDAAAASPVVCVGDPGNTTTGVCTACLPTACVSHAIARGRLVRGQPVRNVGRVLAAPVRAWLRAAPIRRAAAAIVRAKPLRRAVGVLFCPRCRR